MATVTIVGNLTDTPELKYTAQGKAVANFTIAETHRQRQPDGTYQETGTTFWRCTLWDAQAENITESLQKGFRVLAVGDARQRSFETRDGEKRTVTEVTVTEIGPSLKWATAQVHKTGGKPPQKPAQPQTPDLWGDDSETPF